MIITLRHLTVSVTEVAEIQILFKKQNLNFIEEQKKKKIMGSSKVIENCKKI